MLKHWLALIALLIPAYAFASPGPGQYENPQQPFLNIIAPNVIDGVTINPNNTGAGNFSTLNTAATTPQGTVFSTALTGNPLMLDNYQDIIVSTSLTSAAMTTIIASTAGQAIVPTGGLTIMVSGTAATATALALECSDGTLIASWPVADLKTLAPIGIGLYSTTLSQVTTGAGLMGCLASKAVMLSNVGTNITGTTRVYVNIPYTVQTGSLP